MTKKKELINDEIVFAELKRIFSYKSEFKKNSEIIERGFVCSKIKKEKVLFVGINPSFTSDAKVESYQYDIDNAVKEYPRHYAKFTKLIENTDYQNNWTYVDLFQFRETNQKRIVDLIKFDPQFLVSQLRLTHKIICEINPEFIIVCNSGASDFFGINKWKKSNGWQNVWFGYDFEFDENLGIDIIKSKNKESILTSENQLLGTPVLFTSTLTYMSRFDKRRLNWQINRIVKIRISEKKVLKT
ncbi:hypothetical protein G1L01_11450 [Tenacibaculum finnmarkense]|uniref:hypothetical protein n=1 Tax=Tenacibaculum finnmarkense TaxID=2781243 RepID=UPI001EFBA5DD|nr:hypothetical protein [Tenacibaculum finnmarkense]MCG8203234.1 hypothetical protein [Tenacibaculum finnmarkense genomovar finnmarkense]MCG8881076.1 hypothetical protein [Tenacibaculum finnmarkense]MCM8865989.1 hypothetical protein [Tenacibaculum finnmarkense genomovar finnmarkense]MCM8896612.1 hypothetical protein [Tenacibaculum finnmarkense genomovar finnmarkense]